MSLSEYEPAPTRYDAPAAASDAAATLACRNATLQDTVGLLRAQQELRLDVVARADAIRARGGLLQIEGVGGEPVLTPQGVTTPPGLFWPTGTCDGGLAEKLGIPLPYLRRTREQRLALYDANVNGWLEAEPGRRFLIRALRNTAPGGVGVARALLSERYKFVDNLDVLMAVLAGIREAGAQVEVDQCDLTERRMYVQLRSTGIAAHAPALLRNYVSPFTGARGADNPLVFAGFVLSNSETGHGSTSIAPRITVQVCGNGLTISKDAMREVHLGGRLGEGVIQWSQATRDKDLELITRQAADAVSTFLDRDYVERVIAELTADAGVRVDDVPATVTHVGKQLRFTDAQQDTILNHFIDGADRTSGGILHAVTSAAQTLEDADDAYHLERCGVRAMQLAAAYQH
jgi:hypothetical protein